MSTERARVGGSFHQLSRLRHAANRAQRQHILRWRARAVGERGGGGGGGGGSGGGGDRNAAAGDSGPVGAQGPYHASGASGQAQATISGSARGGQDINININLTSSPGTNHDSSIRAHSTANDRADDSLDGSTDPLTCQFCGKYDEAFVDGDVLDLHYWKASFLYTIPSVLCMRFFLSFFLSCPLIHAMYLTFCLR